MDDTLFEFVGCLVGKSYSEDTPEIAFVRRVKAECEVLQSKHERLTGSGRCIIDKEVFSQNRNVTLSREVSDSSHILILRMKYFCKVSKISVYVLMSLLLLMQVRYTVVQLDYSIHKEYIITVLCIEKDIPESTCEGKCHLKKELAKLDKRQGDQGSSPIQIPVTSVEFTLDAYEIQIPSSPIIVQKQDAALWCDNTLSSREHTVESPPPELTAFA